MPPVDEPRTAEEAFTDAASRHLREPLQQIGEALDALRRRTDAGFDDAARRQLDAIARKAGHVTRLLDALGAYSRLSQVELQPSRVPLGRVARELVAELRATGDVEWQVHEMPEVTGDPALLRQALRQLLVNALKFTRTRERPRIEVGTLARGGRDLIAFVRDNGVGFEGGQAGRLFEVFARLHPTDEFEGVGIGLASVRRIVERHGGSTWAEGAPGEGATFYFSLPRGGEAS
jgi:light-regulated signal transduction histidine kinase (bacteriophytochrome)